MRALYAMLTFQVCKFPQMRPLYFGKAVLGHESLQSTTCYQKYKVLGLDTFTCTSDIEPEDILYEVPDVVRMGIENESEYE
jgi:hypothetical protein